MASVGTITVELALDSSKLTSGLKDAISQLDSFGKKAQGIEGSMKGLGSTISSSLGTAGKVGFTALAAGAAATGAAVVGLGAGVKESLTTFRDFETAVTQAASVTGKTGAEFDKAKAAISDVSKTLGADTVFSAQEAANAMYTLASAGVDVSNMSASQLKPALDLAAGSQTDLSSTMDTMVAVSSQFGISFEDNARVADVFATSIGQSQATMEKLAYSFNYVGPVANAAGLSLEKTTAALSVLYDNGLKGQQAGTGLRGVIASLSNPTDKAAAVLKQLGLTVDDVNPATRDLGAIMGDLQARGMTTAQAFTLFNRTAAPAALILGKNSSAISEYTTKLENAGGAAGTIAAEQMDTLAGSLEKLSGSFENVKIAVGEAFAPVIRSIAESLDAMMPSVEKFTVGVVNAFLDMGGKLGSSIGAITNIGQTIGKIFTGVFANIAGTGMGSELTSAINQMFTGLADTIENAAPAIETAINTILEVIRNTIAGLGPTVTNLKTIGANIVTVFKTLFSSIASSVGGTDISATLSSTINVITGVLASFSTLVTGAIVAVAPTLTSIFTAIVGAFSYVVTNFDSIKAQVEAKFAAIEMVFGQLGQKLSPAFQAIKAAFDAGMAAIQSSTGGGAGIWATLKSVWDQLPTILMDAINKLQPVWNFLNAAFTFASGVFQGFIANIGPTWDNIKSIFESGVQILTQVGGDIANALSGMFTSMSGGDGGQSLGKSIAETINTISGAVADLMKWLAENPKVVEFGVALAGIAVAAVSLVIPLAGLIGTLGSIGGAIGAVIGFFTTFGVSFGTLGTAIKLIAGVLFPNFTAALGTIGGAIGPVASLISGGLSAAFGILSSVIGVITGTVIPGIIAALSAIGAPILIIIGIIALVAVAWTQNWFNIQGVAASAVAFLGAQWEALKAAFAQIGPAFSQAAAQLGGVWDQIKTGVSSAFDGIVSALSGYWDQIKAAFQAGVDAATATVTGWYTSLQTAWTQVGTSLSTLYTTLQGYWTQIQTAFQTAITTIAGILSGWYTSLQGIWTQVGTSLGTLYTTLQGYWTQIQTAFSTGITAVVTTLQGWYTSLQGVWTQIQAAFSALQAALSAAWAALQAAFSAAVTAITAVVTGWQSSLSAVWEGIKAAFETFKAALTAAWEALKTAINTAVEAIKTVLNAFHTACVAIYNLEVAGFNTFKAALQAAWDALKAAITTVTAAIKAVLDTFNAACTALYNTMVAAYNTFKASMTTAWDAFKQMITTATNAVKTQLDTWHAQLTAIYEQAKTALQELYDKVKSIWDLIVQTVKTKATELLDTVKKIPGDIQALATNFYNAGKAILESFIKAITEKMTEAYNKAKAGLDKVKDLLPNSPAKEGPFKKLPNWDAVLKDPLFEGIARMNKAYKPLQTILGTLAKPIDAFTGAQGTSPLDPLIDSVGKIEDVKTKFDSLNKVGFDNVNNSLQSMIDKMTQVVDTSENMTATMKSNSGFNLTSTIATPSSSDQLRGSMTNMAQTNIKIGTQNNYKTGESARSLRNALASN